MKSQITKILMFLSFLTAAAPATRAQEAQPSPDTVVASDPWPSMPASPVDQAVSPKVTIPSGTTLAIRLVDSIDSETAQPGEVFHATLDSPLAVDGDTAIPSGYGVEGHIVDVKSAGKFVG